MGINLLRHRQAGVGGRDMGVKIVSPLCMGRHPQRQGRQAGRQADRQAGRQAGMQAGRRGCMCMGGADNIFDASRTPH